ncbi:hypothetical protein EHQ53_02990 [Leptospira langatensis]|uniref:Uncharacterized protein n=1 Tax=Leptospira langatensis TaxID=2484983 RepID=A0A5F1ZZD7_9LEPT|nr:hypothetical protein [Leptospira langatensis]TGK04130.1 hypothetical protein EHO57_03220 [Leptospira langatensis]TGL43610.1 hypothetical protein EHQ53_02990 [Leptospira langatensis]
MSKVLRRLFSLLFLLFPLALFSAEKSPEDVWNSFLEWSGHPILVEERIVKVLSQEYLQELRKETEEMLDYLLTNSPDLGSKQQAKTEKLREQLQNLQTLEGVQYKLPGGEWETILLEKGNFPDSFYEFETPKLRIRYVFKSLPYKPVSKWRELKLQGSFFLYSESGALLLSKSSPDFPIKDLDMREIRAYYETEKKHRQDVKKISENGTELYYFANHNLIPFYALLLSKVILIVSAFIIFSLYIKRFWTFLRDQTRRSRKAEASYLRSKEKVEGQFLSD